MPTVAKLQKDLAAQDVLIVPVAFDAATKARDFLTKKSIDVWSLVDEDGKVAALYGARALPKTFAINREGFVVRVLVGKLSESELRKAVHDADTGTHP
jgi:peroxiredoxin